MAKGIVTLPDGSRQEIEAESREALIEKANSLSLQPKASAGDAFAEGTAERLVGGVLGVPEFIARGARGGSNVLRSLAGQDMEPIPPEGILGLPSGREGMAGIEAGLGGLLGIDGEFGNFGERLDQSVRRREQTAEQQPLAHLGGQVAGDALTLMSGRLPGIRATSTGQRTAQTTTDIIAPAMKRELSRVFRSEAADKLSRAAGRSAEAGLEGAVLSAIQGGDPLETAALSGSTQMAGLIGLKVSDIAGIGDLLRGRFIKGGSKLGASAFAVGSIIQALKESTPGGKDFILESMESGFGKIPWMVGLGAVSAMTGAGRIKGGQIPAIKAELPKLFMDALSTVPRTATISIIRDITKPEEQNIPQSQADDAEKAFIRVLSKPEAFSKEQLSEMGKGISEGDFVNRIGKLVESDEDFRELLDANPGLMGVPEKDEE